MFLGHFGLAFAAKKINRQPSLGTTFLAAQFVDLLWPFFLLLGIEKVEVDPGNTAFTPLNFVSYPFSHSLAAVLIWAVLFGLIYFMFSREGRSALLLSFLVISHWLLDLVTHRPDLQLSIFGETVVGLGLWNNVTATIITEMIIFLGGVLLYNSATKPKNKTGIFAFWGLVIFFILIYVMNIVNKPPPDPTTIAYVGFAQWLLIIWGYWVDANRLPK